MIKVNEYKIVFKRRWHEPHQKTGRYDTICEIYLYTRETPEFTGVAKLHPNDQPDRIEGKKIALRNALDVGFSSFPNSKKMERTTIWKAFWKWVASWSPGHAYLYCERGGKK